LSLVYLDASAAAKLVIDETESSSLREWLETRQGRISSVLLRTELLRAARRAAPTRTDRARQILLGMNLYGIDDDVIETAAGLDPLGLRTLDAIHLATALRVGSELDAIVSYDRRMIDAARALGLPVASPS
jgi:predicted nucleic acid-binding protein